MYPDTDLVPLSALQHFMYCPRQCALIHMEQVWVENRPTAEGQIVNNLRVSTVHRSAGLESCCRSRDDLGLFGYDNGQGRADNGPSSG